MHILPLLVSSPGYFGFRWLRFPDLHISGKHKSPKAHYQCMKGEKTHFLNSFCTFSSSSYIFQMAEIQEEMTDQMSYKDKNK